MFNSIKNYFKENLFPDTTYKMEMPKQYLAKLLYRKNELGAVAGIGLMNLSGLSLPADMLCGIYLQHDRVLFEASGLHLEIPFTQIIRIFVEAQTDVTFYSTYKPKRSFARDFNLVPIPDHPSSKKPKAGPEYITEYSLVFEVVKRNTGSTEYIIFAFEEKQLEEIEGFIQCFDEIKEGGNKDG